MAWTKTTVNDRVVLSETLTLANTVGGTTNTSAIEDVPPNSDFTVVVTDNDNVAAAVDANVLISHDDTTYVSIKANLITGIDNNSVAGFYDNSANGDAPYYKVQIEEDGATAAGASKTVTVKVSVPARGH